MKSGFIGVIVLTSWYSGFVSTPITASRVVWGLGETIETFSPTSTLTSVDLPALALPNSTILPRTACATFWVTTIVFCIISERRFCAL